MHNSLILYVAELFYATALFCAKGSILSFYWRMFRVTNIKLPIQILACCSLIWIIIRVSGPVVYCPRWKTNNNRHSWASSIAYPCSASGIPLLEALVPLRTRSSFSVLSWSTLCSISQSSPCRFSRFVSYSYLSFRRSVSCSCLSLVLCK